MLPPCAHPSQANNEEDSTTTGKAANASAIKIAFVDAVASMAEVAVNTAVESALSSVTAAVAEAAKAAVAAVAAAAESAVASVTAAVTEAAKAAMAAAAESAVASVTAVALAAKDAMTAAAESVEPVESVEPMAPVEPMEHFEPVHTTATTATVYAVKKAVIMTFLIDNSPTSTYNRKHFSEIGGLSTSGVCDHPFSDLCGNGKDDIKYTGNRTGASGKREFWLLVPEVCKLLTEFKFLKKDIIIAKIRELWQLTQTDVQLSDEIKAILDILVSRANILLQDCSNELVDSLRSELVICASDVVNMAKTILHGNSDGYLRHSSSCHSGLSMDEQQLPRRSGRVVIGAITQNMDAMNSSMDGDAELDALLSRHPAARAAYDRRIERLSPTRTWTDVVIRALATRVNSPMDEQQFAKELLEEFVIGATTQNIDAMNGLVRGMFTGVRRNCSTTMLEVDDA
eukprot:gene32666-biopygen12036